MKKFENLLADLGNYETFFRLRFKRSPLGIAVIDAISGEIYEINDHLAAILGRPIKELIGVDWMRFTHAADLTRDLEERDRLLSGDIDSFCQEKRYVLPDGSPVWANVTVIPVSEHSDQTSAYLMAIVENINDRKTQEHELQQANERVAIAERSAKAGIWDWNMRTGSLIWSPALYQLYGRPSTSTEASFDLWRSLLHLGDIEDTEANVNAAIINHVPHFSQYRIVLQDGTIRWIDSHGDTVYDEFDVPIRMIGFCIDVTERKLLSHDNAKLARLNSEYEHMQQKLKASEERLELALSASSLGLWDYSVPSGRVIYDKRWCEILGYQPDNFDPHIDSWKRRVHPDDFAEVQRAVESYLNGDLAIHQSEHRLRHKEGHWVWVFASGKIAERDDDDNPVRVVGTLLDISHQKRLSQEGTNLAHRIELLLRDTMAIPSETQRKNSIAPDKSEIENLSRRHRQILVLIAQGLTSQEISEKLHIAKSTAITHRRELMRKLNLHSATEVTRFAVKHQLVGG